MDEKLKAIVDHLSPWNPNFDYANPKLDSVTISNISSITSINRFGGTDQKLVTFTIYCLFDDFVTCFETANNIFGYLNLNKKINEQLRITQVIAPVRVLFKQGKNLYIVEFQVIGL